MDLKKVKSWQIAALTPSILLIIGIGTLITILIVPCGGCDGIGFGGFFVIVALAAALILAGPATLLMREKTKKAGAILCLVIFLLTTIILSYLVMDMQNDATGQIILLTSFLIPELPLLIAGIHYFWKKQ